MKRINSRAQDVGWPPIRSFRKNMMASNSTKNNDEAEGKPGFGWMVLLISERLISKSTTTIWNSLPLLRRCSAALPLLQEPWKNQGAKTSAENLVGPKWSIC
ncbi:uncharacterized protein [Cicer arietinum]|uniref:uncharacterized protein n=1 Tax=Cicer arietinum TaxID=3827 RepID=UPI003CC536B7